MEPDGAREEKSRNKEVREFDIFFVLFPSVLLLFLQHFPLSLTSASFTRKKYIYIFQSASLLYQKLPTLSFKYSL